MRSSDKLDELAASLYAVQRDLKNPAKNTAGAVRGSKTIMYADLPSILDHLRPKLDAVSLAVVQDVRDDGLYTIVLHSSGQWLELGPYPLAQTNDDQQRGASITYGRRATLSALFRIAADDADADSAASSPPQVTHAAPAVSGRDGAADDRGGEGTGVDGEDTSVPEPPQIDPVQDETPTHGPSESTEKSDLSFHPSKPHRMKPAPEFPGYLMCAVGKCAYWEYVGVEVTA